MTGHDDADVTPTRDAGRTETDVEHADDTVGARPMGGEPDPDTPDANSTTGTTPNEEFVGRVQGQDVGYEGETGAERRAAVEGD